MSIKFLTQPIDAAVSYMKTFFTFIHDPLRLLQRVRLYIRKKILVDLNPRGRITIPNVMDMLKSAGFQSIAWRPFFVPSDNEAARGCTENTQSVRRRAGSAQPAVALEV